MSRSASPVPKALTHAARSFARWRRQRDGWRLPDVLWNRAASLACRYGVSRTAQVLGLNYGRLKDRSDAFRREKERSAPDTSPFVEMLPVRALACVLELEGPDGGKLRIRLKGAHASDLAASIRAFREPRS